MRLSQSVLRKLVATAVTAVVLVFLYEATIIDSEHATREVLEKERAIDPGAGASLQFTASAYCKGAVTASGVVPRRGVAAADERLLPAGSVIQIGGVQPRWAGIYTVLDTGPLVHGRKIDLYMWSCHEALEFGRRNVDVVVLRLGWNPGTTPPSLLDTLLGWRP
jgi:3D (Asp-Asp-Asp) domain-containing protein